MAEEDNTEMSNEEAEEYLKKALGVAPVPEEKHNVHTFLHKVATSEDTTKTGNLTEEEVGTPRLPLRTYKELAVFCDEVADMDYYANYFRKKGEILTSTSLSRDGMLLKLAVVVRKEVSNVLKAPMKANRGWFKKKTKPTGGLEI